MNLQTEQSITDTTAAEPGPYDSIWAHTTVPSNQPQGLEKVMLAEDKLYVVLIVVLIIWAGIVVFLFRTDRRIQKVERSLSEGIGSPDGNT
jgi:CcmD family protein